MWVSASLVVFSAAGGVVGSWGGVGGGGGVGHWVGYGYVDVGGCVVVGGNDIHDGSFKLWWVWWVVDVAVEFWEVYFELGVLTVLLEPFGECAGDVVVALDSVWASAAGGGVLGIAIEWVLTLIGGGRVLAGCVALVVCLSETEFDGCCVVLVW